MNESMKNEKKKHNHPRMVPCGSSRTVLSGLSVGALIDNGEDVNVHPSGWFFLRGSPEEVIFHKWNSISVDSNV